ncbi:MAG: glycosyltransferase family protein, partial [Zoogloeaceae bacterium]|jgi:GT2 family glycosyltransferase|nr:glycosyltransferase family protein [Zoogloeaceae bacterium]
VLILDADFAAKISARLKSYDLLGFCGTDRLLAAGWIAAGRPHIFGAIAHVHEHSLQLEAYGVGDWPVTGNIQALDGLCLMATREAALATKFDADTFDGFHLYDLDFSFSAHLAGYRLGVCCDIAVIHTSGGNFGAAQFAHYARRFKQKYAACLPPDVRSKTRGKAAQFRDHYAILDAWKEDILRRATYPRQSAHEPVRMAAA